ncbi:hypothetical protein [Streptomyces sp. MST-110588]|uniref:hypothetical protein n=1 Tax=Streptomyces sp. MST-110588 TaxID=2833628 RepID=UPI001F5C9792|nr:hypothetical protein [Streptomyces sp. MST-110588]UNO42904.1 hypothetical protein KGS77_29575 [Streptomyces sp. MST-110588]
MPEPGSKRYDRKRAERRREAENHGVPDKHANEEANASLQADPHWRSAGPRTARGKGPKGERPEHGGG